MINGRVSQSGIENLKDMILSKEWADPRCRMMLIRIIQMSEGLTVSTRAVVDVSNEESVPSGVSDIQEIIDDLNDKVKELEDCGRFHWVLGDGLFVIWYDNTGMIESFHGVEKEVGYFTGKDRRLILHFSERLPKNACMLTVETGAETGPAKVLHLDDAIMAAVDILGLLPGIKVTMSTEPDHKDAVRDAVAHLLRTRAESELLESEAKA